jgi:hypothetical protein
MRRMRALAGCLLLVGVIFLGVAWVAAWYPIARSFGDATGSCGSVGTPSPVAGRTAYCRSRIDSRRHTVHIAFMLGLVLGGVGLIGVLVLSSSSRGSDRSEAELDIVRPGPPEP